MKHIAILVAVLFTLSFTDQTFAQKEAKMGYYVTNEGDTLKRRIKYRPNMTTVSSIFVSSSPTGKFEELQKSKVKAFSMLGLGSYERHVTIIDKSSNNIDDLITNRKYKVEVDTVFLRILVSGPIKILIYSDLNRGDQFFYQKDNGQVKPLVKRLMVDEEMIIKENREYLSVLKEILDCKSISEKDFQNLQYSREDIIRVVYKHNKCVDPNSRRPLVVRSKFDLHVSVRGGAVYNSLEFKGSLRTFQLSDATLISGIGYQVSALVELVPPIYNRPVSIILEPTLFGFSADNLSEEKPSTETISADLNSLQIPLGIRCIPINKPKYRMFVSSGFSPTFWSKSDVAHHIISEKQNLTNLQFFFGAGINSKKLNAEIRYNTLGNPVYKRPNYGIAQSKLAFIVGYQLF